MAQNAQEREAARQAELDAAWPEDLDTVLSWLPPQPGTERADWRPVETKDRPEPAPITPPKVANAMQHVRHGRLSLRDPMTAARFLSALACTGHASSACMAAGVSARHYADMRGFPRFVSLCDQALDRYRALVHAEVQRRAIEGVEVPQLHQGVVVAVVRKYSDKLLERVAARVDESYAQSAARTTVSVTATATAVAGSGPGAAPMHAPGLDPARMTREERDMYRKVLQSMAARGALDAPVSDPIDTMATETPCELAACPPCEDSTSPAVSPRPVLPADSGHPGEPGEG